MMGPDNANGWPDDAREALEWALAIHFSQNRQPCMSGDPRDRLSSLQRRNMEDARDAALEALAPVVTQRERAAAAAAWMAAREACIQGTLGERLENEPDNDMDRAYMTALAHVVDTLRALPLPAEAAAALAEVVRKAKEEERETIMQIVRNVVDTYETERILLESIRARSTEGGA